MRQKICKKSLLELKAVRMELTEKEKQELNRLEKGNEGENMVVDFIQKFGHPNWKILRNITFDAESPVEIDILVVGKIGWVAFEVKNYEGDFTYDNGSCYYNQTQMTRDIVAQARRVHLKMTQLNQNLQLTNSVKTALTFTNEHNEITIQQPPNSIQVLKRNQLKNFIQELALQEAHAYSRISIEEQVETLENLNIGNSKYLPLLDEEVFGEMKKGIYCPLCKSFSMKRSRQKFYCTCGHKEFLKDAVERTIDEYAQLFHDRDLTTSEIVSFINNETSYELVYKVLRENFVVVGESRSKFYVNHYKESKIE